MKKIMLRRYKILKTNAEKTKGLMFLDKVEERLVFIFKNDIDSPFHSFFCPEFDIIFLNEKMRVNEYQEVRTWRFIKPKKKYKYVLEAEPGFIRKNKINIGDLVILD
ncbi:MAG: DUF192 domain-containing protein [Candidatus Micrarchaeia archaeon]